MLQFNKVEIVKRISIKFLRCFCGC